MVRRRDVAWRDAEGWARLRDGSACPICRDGRPRDVVATLPASWVTAPREATLPGYVCVVSNRHAVESFELPPRARARFWQDVLVVAKAMAALFNP
jgi:diadenosine tetraphosphate (Ap4A) HIT family hydrolase